MSTSPLTSTNLPTTGDRPAIDEDAHDWVCQVHTRHWSDGFVFTYCAGRQRYVISWGVADRWRTRRQLHVCAAHGREFAEQHGITMQRIEAIVPAAVVVDAPENDDPFGDVDQPYERVRGQA